MFKFLEKKVRKTLDLPDKFNYFKEGEIYDCSLKFKKRILGIFPLYKTEKRQIFLWGSFKKLFDHLRNVRDKMFGLVDEFNSSFSSNSISILIDSLRRRIGPVKTKVSPMLKEKYSSVHDELISGIISDSRNEFRKELLERMGKESKDIFKNHATNNLNDLIQVFKDAYGEGNSKEDGFISIGGRALPSGVRFVFNNNDVSVYVVEQAPQVRMITYGKNTRTFYNLSFPYVIFFVCMKRGVFSHLRLFFRNKPLTNLSDKLYWPALPNIRSDTFKVCFPAPGVRGDPSKVVEETINQFWKSTFNSDWNSCLQYAESTFSKLSSFSTWQEESKKDPNFILSIKWRNADRNVKRVINYSVEQMKGESPSEFVLPPVKDFIDKLGNEISQDIQEKCFFLVQHWVTDDKSLEIASKKLEEELENVFSFIEGEFRKEVEHVFSKDNLNEKMTTISKQIISEIKANLARDLREAESIEMNLKSRIGGGN